MALTHPWLATYSWEFVTAQNALLCQAKGALHQPTPTAMTGQNSFGNSGTVSPCGWMKR